MATQELQARIEELLAQKANAERAEQERLAAEQRNRQQIAAADAELRKLQKQQAQEAFQAALDTNRQLVVSNTQAVAPLRAALDDAARLIADAMRDLMPQVNTSFEWQQQHIDAALSQAMQHADVPKPLHGKDATVDPRTVENEVHNAQRMAYGALNNEADGSGHAVPAWAALARWIADAPDAEQQIRVGIYYALFGQVLTPNPQYDPHAEIREIRRSQRNRRF